MGSLVKATDGHLAKKAAGGLVKVREYQLFRKVSNSNISWADVYAKFGAYTFAPIASDYWPRGYNPYSQNSYYSALPQKWWMQTNVMRWDTADQAGDTYTDVRFYADVPTAHPFYKKPYNMDIILYAGEEGAPPSSSLAAIRAYPSQAQFYSSAGTKDVTLGSPITLSKFLYIFCMEQTAYTDPVVNNTRRIGRIRHDVEFTLHN